MFIRKQKRGLFAIFLSLALSGCVVALGSPLAAQESANPDLTTRQLSAFDQFLDEHPDVAKQLQSNPSLVNNQEFLEDHAQLQTFLNSHPELREEFKENPSLFMQRERQFEG